MKKIGIIDSGIGGLTLLRELIAAQLDAEFYYISDSKNVPYGGKSQEFMLKQMKSMVAQLLDKKIDGIVIACNTLTAETIEVLRGLYTTPIIGIEPYLNYLNHSPSMESNSIALILTPATFNSQRFSILKIKIDPNSKIDVYPLENLALHIEQLASKKFIELRDKIINELSFLENSSYTHLILGCTHYPIIKEFIEEQFNICCIDPSLKVVAQVEKTLELKKLESSNGFFYYNSNNSTIWIKKNLSEFNFL